MPQSLGDGCAATGRGSGVLFFLDGLGDELLGLGFRAGLQDVLERKVLRVLGFRVLGCLGWSEYEARCLGFSAYGSGFGGFAISLGWREG